MPFFQREFEVNAMWSHALGLVSKNNEPQRVEDFRLDLEETSMQKNQKRKGNMSRLLLHRSRYSQAQRPHE